LGLVQARGAGVGEVTAWLIENYVIDRPYWLTVYLGEMTYSADVNDAIRFSSPGDAVKMLDHKFFNAPVTVVEHVFL